MSAVTDLSCRVIILNTSLLFVVDRIFSYLDVTSLCRCARVSRYWKLVALDGSNWQHVDLFSFQTDIEVAGFSVL